MKRLQVLLSTLFFMTLPLALTSAEQKIDERYPFRTSWANQHLDWYKPKNLEFPPHHSDVRISGELVSLDYVRRRGSFRKSQNGELVKFTMPPYGVFSYLNAESHLRNVPIGVHFLFFLIQDEDGKFTRLVTAQDQFTMDKSHAFTYKVKEVKTDSVLAEKHSLKKGKESIKEKEFLLADFTKCFKMDKEILPSELKEGDEILVTLCGKKKGFGGYCREIYVGLDTHDFVEKRQMAKFTKFQRMRGIPGWVTHTEGKSVEIALFSGQAKSFHKIWMKDFAVGDGVQVVVANDEIRTWNPPVDKNRSRLTKISKLPLNAYGCSGVKITVKTSNMLEGFRPGRVVRVFGKGWKLLNPYYGESLMNYGFARLKSKTLLENPAKEYPSHYPFRTDYGNRHLEWLKPVSADFPPEFAEHLVLAKLLSVDSDNMSGIYETEFTGEQVKFSLFQDGKGKVHKEVKIQKLGQNSKLSELKIGERYRFETFKGKSGQFSIVTNIRDEYSFLKDEKFYYKISKIDSARAKIEVLINLPDVKNYNKDFEAVPDLGAKTLKFNQETTVWKEGQELKITELKVGDHIRVNLSAESAESESICTGIWLIKE